jgi:hypothetical protein
VGRQARAVGRGSAYCRLCQWLCCLLPGAIDAGCPGYPGTVFYTRDVVAQRGEAVAISQYVPSSRCLCWWTCAALCTLNEAAQRK